MCVFLHVCVCLLVLSSSAESVIGISAPKAWAVSRLAQNKLCPTTPEPAQKETHQLPSASSDHFYFFFFKSKLAFRGRHRLSRKRYSPVQEAGSTESSHSLMSNQVLCYTFDFAERRCLVCKHSMSKRWVVPKALMTAPNESPSGAASFHSHHSPAPFSAED